MADNAASTGILQRTLLAVKYAITGTTPSSWFGPLNPLIPQAPEEVKGRQWDYRVGYNLDYRPRAEEPVGFDKLKALAKNSNLLRIVMEGQKDKIEALDWAIKPREKAGGKRGVTDASILAIQTQLEFPDKIHDWAQWLRALLEQLFVLDAVSIYRRRDRGGLPYAFELLDGATIKPLIDQSGRAPVSPSPAYQQILKGLPAVDYSTDELLYYPHNVRADHAYGYSRVEQIVDTVETAIARMKSQKGYFTHGNLSDGFFTAPAGVQPDQIAQVETMWNNLLTASVENRRVGQFLPGGFVYNEIGQPPLQDTFDEWLARVICFTFSTAPTPFMKQQGMGHGSAGSEHDAAEAAGLANIMGYVRRVMNRILFEDFGRPDLEFDWVEDREFDPDIKSQIEDRRLKNGSLTLNEVRDRNGEDKIEGGDVPLIYIPTGAVRVEDVTAEPPPPPTVVHLPAPGSPPAPDGKPADASTENVDDPGEKPAVKNGLNKAATAETRLAAVLSRYLAKKGAAIATTLGASLGMAKAAPSSDDSSHRFDEALADIDWDWSDLPGLVQPAITGIAVAAGTDAVSDLGLFDKDTLAKMTANASDYAQSRSAELIGKKLVDGDLVDNPGWSIPSATRDMIKSAVVDAMESGASNDELATAVRESAAFSKERAATFARTETAKADTEGARAGWRASGLVAGRQWAASPDCCDECQALDGTVVGIDDDFPDGADVPLHPNCECAEIPVLPEDMPDSDSDDADED